MQQGTSCDTGEKSRHKEKSCDIGSCDMGVKVV